MNEEKLKHLEFIQSVVSRMASNSFLIKGWSITLIVGIFVLSAKDSNPIFAIIPFLPVLAFWGLDAYFLRQERLFKKLYDDVRISDGESVQVFSMSTQKYNQKVASWLRICFSKTILGFHGPLLLVVILVNVVIKNF